NRRWLAAAGRSTGWIASSPCFLSYSILAMLSSIVGFRIPRRRGRPASGCRRSPLAPCWPAYFLRARLPVYVYGTIGFFGLGGGFVDSRRCRQHECPRRPASPRGRRNILPSSAPGLRQFVQRRLGGARLLQPPAALLNIAGRDRSAFPLDPLG